MMRQLAINRDSLVLQELLRSHNEWDHFNIVKGLHAQSWRPELPRWGNSHLNALVPFCQQLLEIRVLVLELLLASDPRTLRVSEILQPYK